MSHKLPWNLDEMLDAFRYGSLYKIHKRLIDGRYLAHKLFRRDNDVFCDCRKAIPMRLPQFEKDGVKFDAVVDDLIFIDCNKEVSIFQLELKTK